MKRQPKTRGESQPLTQGRAALLLGVTPVHLSYVLTGNRQSPKLLLRYKELIERHARGELADEDIYSDIELHCIGTIARCLRVEKDKLRRVLSRDEEDPDLLQNYRLFVRMLVQRRPLLALIQRKKKRSRPDQAQSTTTDLQAVPNQEPKQNHQQNAKRLPKIGSIETQSQLQAPNAQTGEHLELPGADKNTRPHAVQSSHDPAEGCPKHG